MANINMCANTLCPNAGSCYRITAEPAEHQSYVSYDYAVGHDGVICDYYIPNTKVTASDGTDVQV